MAAFRIPLTEEARLLIK